MTMGAAALNDALAWCLLILAISIANASDMNSAAWAFLSTVAFALCLFFVIQPLLSIFVARCELMNNKKIHDNLFIFTLMLVFLSAWTTGE